MFDFLKRGSAPSLKQIDKLVKRLTEPGGENAPRIEAAEKLAEWGTRESLYALLKRFTISSNVITQDIEEKRMVVRMLVEKGSDAVEPILRFLSSHHNVEWPVQALSEILPRQELVPKLVEILEKVAAASDFTPPEHKADLIRAMHDVGLSPEVELKFVPMRPNEMPPVRRFEKLCWRRSWRPMTGPEFESRSRRCWRTASGR